MQHRLNIWYKTLALLIAGSFVYVQATALSCGVHHIIDQAGVAHEHPFGHDHHHDHEAQPEEDHQDAGSHDESENSCCVDFTGVFFSTFSGSQVEKSTVVGKINCFENAIAQPLHVSFARFVYAISVQGKEYFHPPPRVPDIRVFIRSFQV
ncbi:MAG TPA: hypothetical protein VK826_14830 [Bacteroidia bacterium]|nr:hypothetical protein [Bacteroidia bacterium]